MSIASNQAESAAGGNFPMQTKEVSVPEFDKVSMSLNGTVRVLYGNTCGLRITAKDDAIEALYTDVSNGTLSLFAKQTNSVSSSTNRSLASHLLDLILKRPTYQNQSIASSANYLIDITTPRLRELMFGGKAHVGVETDLHESESMKIFCHGASTAVTKSISAPELHLVSSGTASLSVEEVSVDSMELQISGKSKIHTGGQANTASARISGIGALEAEKLTVNHASFVTSGKSNAAIHAQKELEVSSSGSCAVKYLGEPQKTTKFSGVLDCSPL